MTLIDSYDISSVSKLSSVASKLLRLLDNRIFAIYGDIGAGKTTFIKHLCDNLNVIDTVSSPTFSIVNEYMSSDGSKFFHFDLYRLSTMQDVRDIGIDVYINSGHYCFIEWPHLMESLLPDNCIKIELKHSMTDRRLFLI